MCARGVAVGDSCCVSAVCFSSSSHGQHEITLQQRHPQNLIGQKTSVLSKKVISKAIKCHKTLALTFGICLGGSNDEVLLGGVARLLANWLHPAKTGRENKGYISVSL